MPEVTPADVDRMAASLYIVLLVVLSASQGLGLPSQDTLADLDQRLSDQGIRL